MSDDEQMVADCEARESRLTEWEADFIQSLRERTDAGWRALGPTTATPAIGTADLVLQVLIGARP